MSAAEALAPDVAGAVEVWRAWHVVVRDGRHQLGSVLKPTVWPRREALVAECLRPAPFGRWVARRFHERHASPEEHCDCGIYGADLPGVCEYLSAALYLAPAGRVLGRVSLWGTVIECERGYRASTAYPLELYVTIDAAPDAAGPEAVVSDLGDYGVPVQLLPARCGDASAAVARRLRTIG